MQRCSGLLAGLLLTLAILGDGRLDISWAEHPDNAQLWVIYRCNKDDSHPAFYAANVWELHPESTRWAVVRRVPTPVGQRCLITANIMRSYPGWDGDHRTLKRGEWQILTYTEER